MGEVQMEQQAGASKPLKEKMTKAERRFLQEAQRAAKAAAKCEYLFFTCFSIFKIYTSVNLCLLWDLI